MARRLTDNLTSSYFEASNNMASKNASRRIVAYVESYDDVFFWRTVLDAFESPRLHFHVTLPSRVPHLERGKKAVLMSLVAGKVGRDMIACVDADYDYLLRDTTAMSHTVNTSPYVFHTYAYAIENMQCYAPSLHQTCVMATLNDSRIFDFEEFMTQYSVAIFPLFVWSIWFYRSTNYGAFTMSDFLRTIDIGHFTLENAGPILQRLRSKVGRKTQRLRLENPHAKESWLALKADLLSLGVTPATTYLYIKGHHLFDSVVVPVMKKVCDALIRERQREISRQSVHSTQRQNELSCYANSIGDVAAMLKKNTGYTASEPFMRIRSDIDRFLAADAES